MTYDALRALGFARHRQLKVALVACAGATTLAATLGVALYPLAASASVENPASILKSATSAMRSERSVHLVIVAKSNASATAETVAADLGSTKGGETVRKGKGVVTLRVSSTSAYLSGNLSGLTTGFGLSTAIAKKLGTRWATFAKSTAQYPALKSAVTIANLTGLIPPAKQTKLSRVTVKGQQLYLLKWTTAASSSSPKLANTMQIAARGKPLPVSITSTAKGGVSETATFSHWNEVVNVAIPASSTTIAYSKLKG